MAAGFILDCILCRDDLYGQVGSFTPLYLPKLGVAASEVTVWTGRVAALAGLLGIPFLPLWGALADRYSRQPIIVRSFVAHLLSGLTMLVAGNVWIFALGRAITGFALGNSGLMMTTLSERTPPRRIGLAFAIMNSAGPVGAFVGPLIGGPLVDRWGFPALLAVDGGLMVIIILAMSLGYRDSFTGTGTGSVLRMALDSVGIVLRSARLWSLFLALFLLFAGWMLVFAYVPLAVKELYQGDQPNTAVGAVVGLGGLSALILGPAMGALADRYGHWLILFIGAILAVALWPLPMLTRDLTLFTILWGIVNGFSSGVFAVSFSVLSGSASADIRGRVMSFAYLPVNLGAFAGPALGSLITAQNIFLIFPIAAVVTALGVGALAAAARLRQAELRVSQPAA